MMDNDEQRDYSEEQYNDWLMHGGDETDDDQTTGRLTDDSTTIGRSSSDW